MIAVSRRGFIEAAGAAGLTAAWPALAARRAYAGPNVVIVRFGGGVRRRETIDPDQGYSPFLARELASRGTLFSRMEMATAPGTETSHGHGTLYILTGKYERYEDMKREPLSPWLDRAAHAPWPARSLVRS